jgi:hypothetical protein
VVLHGVDTALRAPEHPIPPLADVGPRGRAIRLVLPLVAAALLLYGTVAGSDDMFPFGPFRMYAGYYPPDGVITSNALMARTANGHDVVVTQADIGLARGDIEGELGSYEANPSRFAGLAAAYHRRHPSASPYVAMWIAQTRWQLHDRAVAGTSVVTLVKWSAG